jgi:hypothetical protein
MAGFDGRSLAALRQLLRNHAQPFDLRQLREVILGLVASYEAAGHAPAAAASDTQPRGWNSRAGP